MSVRRKRNLDDEDYSQPGPSQRQKKVSAAKALSQRSENDDGDFEPQDFSQSQTNLSSEALTEIINTAVIQILTLNYSLKPIKRCDILLNPKAKGRLANQVMEDVKKRLYDIYGLTLLEFEPQKYIVINPMNKKLEKYILGEQKSPKRDLLGLLLTIIFVNNMQVHEDKLRECLQKVKVDLQDNHPYFGDVNKHLQEFERQMYIVKDNVATAKGQVEKTPPFYVWGLRAKHEISMNSILEVLAKIYDTNLENLPPSLKNIAARFTEPESMEEFA